MKYTKEEIQKIFTEVFAPKFKEEFLGCTHNEWEENGEKFSSWTFKTDRGSFTTGDGGKREMDRIFQEELEKMFKDLLKLI